MDPDRQRTARATHPPRRRRRLSRRLWLGGKATARGLRQAWGDLYAVLGDGVALLAAGALALVVWLTRR